MNGLDIGLAFLEGVALIVSPCILPVLPLVLATSVSGGRHRPYSIIIGFVLAFTLFAIVARKLVSLLGLDLGLVKDASLVLLALLGLVLLSARLSEKFSALTQGAADFGNRLAGAGGEGMLGGIAIGALIGLVWTPCAGPILAAVLVQVIRQQSDFSGNLVILSFGIGARPSGPAGEHRAALSAPDSSLRRGQAGRYDQRCDHRGAHRECIFCRA